MLDHSTILGRIFQATEYGKAKELLKQFTPMLKGTQHVGRIFNAVQEQYANESDHDRMLIFICACYQAYQPLSFLPTTKHDDAKTKQAAGKLPPGIRDEIARCLKLNHSEEVNRYLHFAMPFMRPFNTGPERPFRIKVMAIVERFKAYSIRPNELQMEMGL